jgi:hypothetical protein
MADVKIIIDGRVIEDMLRSPSGAMGRFMLGGAEIVRLAAIEDCPRDGTSIHSVPLHQSIVTRYEETEFGFSVRIVAQAPYAAAVHEGAKPHVINAKPGKMLAFEWPTGPNGPGMYFFKSVNHPGNQGNPFLSKNLRLFGAI